MKLVSEVTEWLNCSLQLANYQSRISQLENCWTVTSYLTKAENRIKKSLTQLSYSHTIALSKGTNFAKKY